MIALEYGSSPASARAGAQAPRRLEGQGTPSSGHWVVVPGKGGEKSQEPQEIGPTFSLGLPDCFFRLHYLHPVCFALNILSHKLQQMAHESPAQGPTLEKRGLLGSGGWSARGGPPRAGAGASRVSCHLSGQEPLPAQLSGLFATCDAQLGVPGHLFTSHHALNQRPGTLGLAKHAALALVGTETNLAITPMNTDKPLTVMAGPGLSVRQPTPGCAVPGQTLSVFTILRFCSSELFFFHISCDF